MKILVLSDSHSGLRFMNHCIDRVEPDVLIYQTFEDYENMVDTVLEWARAD